MLLTILSTPMHAYIYIILHTYIMHVQLNAEISAAKKDLKRVQTIMQMDELKCRKRVLRRYVRNT